MTPYQEYISWKPRQDYYRGPLKVGEHVHLFSHRGTFRVDELKGSTVKVSTKDMRNGLCRKNHILTVRSNISAKWAYNRE